MLGAAATHWRRGEMQLLPLNLLIAALAMFVAIERFGPHAFRSDCTASPPPWTSSPREGIASDDCAARFCPPDTTPRAPPARSFAIACL
jgi:hypothetical protein